MNDLDLMVWTLVYCNCGGNSLESLKEGACYAMC